MSTLTMDDIRLGDTVRLRNGETIVVDGVYETYGDRDGEYPGPWVKGPGWKERYLLADVTAIVERNPRDCRFCGNGVTSTNPEIDYCRICHYTGRAQQDMHAVRIAEIESGLPEGWMAMVEHTGGGCFWLAIRHDANRFYYACTAHDAVLPDDAEGEDWSWVFRYHHDESHEDYEGVAIIHSGEPDVSNRRVAEAITADIARHSS